jgi:hypothetical protein
MGRGEVSMLSGAVTGPGFPINESRAQPDRFAAPPTKTSRRGFSARLTIVCRHRRKFLEAAKEQHSGTTDPLVDTTLQRHHFEAAPRPEGR